jgi:peptide/nickel transport system substrate-binding protein
MKDIKRPTYLVLATAGLALSGMLVASGPAAAQGKTVTIVGQDEMPDHDLCNAMRSTQGRVMRQNVGEALTKINPVDGTVTPLLATSWKQTDPNTWRFTLRKGVNYHDGSPFNAAAVVKALQRTYYAPALFCENRSKSGMKTGISFKAIDEHTVDIGLDVPAPILPVRMGVITMTHPDAPLDALQTELPIGTGPYVFTSYKSDQEIILTRFDGYWGDKPEVESARYIYRKESSVRAAMVKIGEADIAPNISVLDADDPTMDFSFLNSETSRLRLEVFTAPLDDKRIRKALNLAIDRDALKGSVFSKDVLKATQHVVPSIAGHNHEIDKRVWPYDPKQAMKLIAEAKADGVAVDTELKLTCRLNQWPGAQEAMEAIMGYFHEVGLNVSLNCIESGLHSDMNRKPYAKGRGALLFQDQHDNNNGDAVFTFFAKYGCEGEQSTICSPEADKLAIDGAQLPTGPARAAKFAEAFRIVYEDVIGDVPLFHMVGYARVGSRINYTPSIATNTEVELSQISFN